LFYVTCELFIKVHFLNSILEKLSALGYQKELDFLDQIDRNWRGGCAVIPLPQYTLFKDHELVKQCKPLTDRSEQLSPPRNTQTTDYRQTTYLVWSNMKATMVKYMEETHNLRLRHERCLVVRQRCAFICKIYNTWRHQLENLKRYPMDSIMPGPADVLKWLVAQGITDKPGDEKVTEGEMARLKTSLPEFIKNFRYSILFNLWIVVDIPYLSIGDYLPLATVVFRCKNDSVHWMYQRNWLQEEGILSQNQALYEAANEIREPCMWYPEFIFHPCCTIVRRPWEEEIAQEHLHLGVENEFSDCRRDPWDVYERLEFDDKASKTVKNLLDACGLNHQTKVVELDELDYRFVCLKCSFGQKCDGERKVRVWSWRDAVRIPSLFSAENTSDTTLIQ